MGLPNAAPSLGAALGGVTGGAIMQWVEYSGLCGLACVRVAVAVVLLLRLGGLTRG